MDTTQIADILFPNIIKTIEDLEKEFPKRDLPEGAQVTRFAPSPTGFVHIGAIFSGLIVERLAHQSGGVFILRIEDTDKNREIEGGVDLIADAFRTFGIPIDEGMWSSTEQLGKYGPYLQSQRKEIYAICAKELIARGLAYPCFCTDEELKEIRARQEQAKVKPGYYGEYAKDRNLSTHEIQKKIDQGLPFAIRIKAKGDGIKKITFQDGIKGSITMPENDQDYVILKSDGLPTYHLGHIVDDHFMRCTQVLRGDEWLPSTPLHLQLLAYFGWSVPKIAHHATIQKMDGTSKRKFSKRKDPEANVVYYTEVGFPKESVKEYLLTIANSNFEEWRRGHTDLSYTDFKVSIEKMNNSGALFDMVKLEDVSKQVIGRMVPEEMYTQGLAWAKEFDSPLAALLEQQKEYTLRIFNIEKDQQGKRKDIARWGQLRDTIGYFYDEEFTTLTKSGLAIPDTIDRNDMLEALKAYMPLIHTMHEERNQWFDHIKEIATNLGYTTDSKAYRQDPTAFKGYVGDIAMFLRIALTNRQNTPDLQEIIRTMGLERVSARLQKAIEYLEQ